MNVCAYSAILNSPTKSSCMIAVVVAVQSAEAINMR